MPTLLIRGPDGTLVERELEGRLTVGCDEDNDLVLRSNGVEKRHANFFAEGGEVVLEQLDASAEKTIVDGAPMRGKKRLQPGVRVLIGDYEVQLKAQQVTVRKVEPLAPEPASTDKPPAQFPFRVVFALFGLALGAIVLGGIWKRLNTDEPPPPPPPKDACADLEPYLRLARGAANKQGLDAVEQVLACDPIHLEGNALKRSIGKMIEAEGLAGRAVDFIKLGRDDQALELIEKIQVEGVAAPLFREVAPRVAKKEKADCDAYNKAGKKEIAKPHCDEHARLTKKLQPEGPTMPEGPTLAERVLERVKEPELAEPVLLYAKGSLSEADRKLGLIRLDMRKASLHAAVDSMRKDLNGVDALIKSGEGKLEKGDLDGAARSFRDVYELDAKLLPEGNSVPRQSAARLMAQKSYELGAVHARRQNWLQACEAWKVGFDFSRGNSDLNSALTKDCTSRAAELADSPHCNELDQALRFAVPGDELAPRISESRKRLGCP